MAFIFNREVEEKMINKMFRKGLVFTAIVLFVGASFLPTVCGNSGVTSVKDTEMAFVQVYTWGAPEVWVDDDYYDGGYNDGHTWGYDAFDNVQEGVDNVNDDGIVNVKEGSYYAFQVDGRTNLDIIGEGQPIITGNQLVYDTSYNPPKQVNNVVFVENSQNIFLEGFEILGTNPTSPAQDFSVFFQNSQVELRDSIIDANSLENMNGLAIRVITYSNLIVENCTIMNYGRIAIYAKTGTLLIVQNCTLIGTTYALKNQVNYGIEIESLDMFCIGVIKGNIIYNHDNTQPNPDWSSAGVLIDTWRQQPGNNCENSSVLIENNDIYDNMHGVQIIPNDHIEVIYNKFYNNNLGAVSDYYLDGSTHVYVDLNAILNWWGDDSGPYHPGQNPNGQGDQVDDNVIFDPWLADISPHIHCDGSLNWANVNPESTVTGSFTVNNTGFMYSELNWKVTENPSWGVWTITPSSGTGLTPEMGLLTVEVSVIAPPNKNKEFTGKIKIINSDNPAEYCEIPVYLKTPKNRAITSQFMQFLENHPNLFPILQRLIQRFGQQ